ncbi:MAG: hypothetical protein Tsb0021_06730 [Chlamydiales bacterium]
MREKSSLIFSVSIPKQLQESDFGNAKASGLNDHKLVNITNINQFMIVQSRGFGEAKIPILEVVSV